MASHPGITLEVVSIDHQWQLVGPGVWLLLTAEVLTGGPRVEPVIFQLKPLTLSVLLTIPVMSTGRFVDQQDHPQEVYIEYLRQNN